ncbi:MAG: hypothetical protein IH931_06505 [candidate division Zixibacteria bacterium]|nr:hypothetical protein [candidate division Zixibacteria bacterium]
MEKISNLRQISLLLVIEIFVIVNIGFLAIDIFIAHSMNAFYYPTEWIPFYFSLVAPLLLSVEFMLNRRLKEQRTQIIGRVVGYCSVFVGILGAIFHLNSSFFESQTIRSLVYAAPFAAPLAYTGLGFLLLLNRSVPVEKLEWGKWLIFLGLGGFVGNFVLALLDHAQNGFFFWTEWIPVFSSAIAIGFLLVTFFGKLSRRFLDLTLAVMFVQVIVGSIGFYFHGMALTSVVDTCFFKNLVSTAPIFAPLLFVNLAFLSGLGIWDVRSKLYQIEGT